MRAHGAASSAHRQLLLIEDNLSNIKVIQQLMGRSPHIELLPAITVAWASTSRVSTAPTSSCSTSTCPT